jgi:hypothetical protein
LWEAFLLQMNDFDRFLESELRHMLDPVVATRPPARKRREEKAPRRPILAVEVPVTPAIEAIPVLEPVAVALAIPVAPAAQL